ncbi:MAG: DUF438 domain-containing protein [Eubacteriaceae bacterium]|nr:DUF438 domain-containing protein [Eubacteriaceae bacterium]
MDQKNKNLINYCQGIHRKENGKELYMKYLEDIQSVTPQELMHIQNEQLKMGMTPAEMLINVDKLINVFYKALSTHQWKKPEEGTFLFYLREENEALTKRLDAFKSVIKTKDLHEERIVTATFLKEILDYNEHLLKLENILFPYLEKQGESLNGLKIMWLLHDQVREKLKDLIRLLEDEKLNEQEINMEVGQLYFKLYGLVQKQEIILFPIATELLDDQAFQEMHRQSFEYAFPFIEAPDAPEVSTEQIQYDGLRNLFSSDTGHFDLEQLTLLLNALPIDLTFVDENDKVAYFSKPKDRVFPRSAAIIGRDVKNCHPPDSVHIVEAILESFKKGVKDEAEFWIQKKGLFIHIQYVALRNSNRKYKGTLEITQEISKLKALEGQRRLLEW